MHSVHVRTHTEDELNHWTVVYLAPVLTCMEICSVILVFPASSVSGFALISTIVVN